MDEAIDALWSKVLEGWEEDNRHRAFLQYCVENRALAEAAKRYRAIARQPPRPDDDAPGSSETPYRVLAGRREDAARRLAAITALAMSSLDAERSTATKVGSIEIGLRVFAVLFFLAALISLVWILAFTDGHPVR